MKQVFTIEEPFVLESGHVIDRLHLDYSTFGKLNTDQSNVIWVFHALTANSDVMSWWPGLFGEDCLFNAEEHYIICVNIIGSPYGSYRPDSLDHPLFTIRDTVNAELQLARHLGINRIHTCIGGSCGGSQAMEFAYAFEGKIDHLIVIASAPKESEWSIAIHEVQRMALLADPYIGTSQESQQGLKTARAVGMLNYRTIESFNSTQREEESKLDDFKVSSYMRYQGEKFAKRFDSIAYYHLTKWMDTHDIGRGRGGIASALQQINIKTAVIAIATDQLVTPKSQEEMAKLLPLGTYYEIPSIHGHDGFLLETKALSHCIRNFITEV